MSQSRDHSYTSYRISVPFNFEEVFSHFYVAENHTDEPIVKTLLPSFQTIMIFSFGTNATLQSNHNEIEVDKCVVLGPIKHAFDYTLPVGANILVANFKGDAFYRFFGDALLADPIPINPDALIDENCFTRLWYDLQKLSGAETRINYILEFCRPYLRERSATSEALGRMSNEKLDPIKTLAQETGQSERNIQINHKKYLGYSAKEVNRYHRFLKAVELIENKTIHGEKPDWQTIIEQCGYYDQSQLIHDFKHFINLSPGKYLAFQEDICRFRPV